MNKEQKVSDKKEKSVGRLWPVLLCLLLAGVVFIFLLNMEAKELAKHKKGKVVVAVADIPDCTEVTEDNLLELFAVAERNETDIPEAAYQGLSELLGQYVKHDVDAGSMITDSMIGELEVTEKDMVLLGVNMENLEQSVAGTLRAGDQIDIYTVELDEQKEVVVEKALENVFIYRSYTSSGTPILKEDGTSIAQYITIPVHQQAVGNFYKALENRKVEIVKHP